MALSPNMLIIKEYVEDKYSDIITHIGVTNCRKIAGSQTYSQHSWPNAIDIHVTDEFKANSIEKSNGDAIFAGLQRTFGNYLYEKIWWTTNHWNHIHVSTYPKGWLTPPCAGGEFRIKFEDGTVQSVSEFPKTIVEKEEDMPLTSADVTAIWSATFGTGSNIKTAGQLLAESHRDAAIARALAEQLVSTGRTLTQTDIDAIVAEHAESFGLIERD